MKTIAELLDAAGFDLEEIRASAAACFAGASGDTLRGALAEISPPLCPTVGETDAETYRLIGRAEVVGWLLTIGDPNFTLTTTLNALYHGHKTSSQIESRIIRVRPYGGLGDQAPGGDASDANGDASPRGA